MPGLSLSAPPKASLEDVQSQIEAWRKRSHRGRRIPESFWDAAVSLCREHSVHSVSRTLRLNYNDLKKRLNSAAELPVTTTFADLGLLAPSTEVVVECEDGTGRRMRIHCKGARAEALAPELFLSFWGAGR